MGDQPPSSHSKQQKSPKMQKTGHQIIKKLNAHHSDDQLRNPSDKGTQSITSNLSNEITPNVKKWLPNYQKMKCLFLDYIQPLMII